MKLNIQWNQLIDAQYNDYTRIVTLYTNDGFAVRILVDMIPELTCISDLELNLIEILDYGESIRWPKLNLKLSTQYLIEMSQGLFSKDSI